MVLKCIKPSSPFSPGISETFFYSSSLSSCLTRSHPSASPPVWRFAVATKSWQGIVKIRHCPGHLLIASFSEELPSYRSIYTLLPPLLLFRALFYLLWLHWGLFCIFICFPFYWNAGQLWDSHNLNPKTFSTKFCLPRCCSNYFFSTTPGWPKKAFEYTRLVRSDVGAIAIKKNKTKNPNLDREACQHKTKTSQNSHCQLTCGVLYCSRHRNCLLRFCMSVNY